MMIRIAIHGEFLSVLQPIKNDRYALGPNVHTIHPICPKQYWTFLI